MKARSTILSLQDSFIQLDGSSLFTTCRVQQVQPYGFFLAKNRLNLAVLDLFEFSAALASSLVLAERQNRQSQAPINMQSKLSRVMADFPVSWQLSLIVTSFRIRVEDQSN
jgi:hypothetical protein